LQRPPVPGTIARGGAFDDIEFVVGKQEDGSWVEDFPIEVNEENMLRGRERYAITCAQCHGEGGDGDGLISQRATLLAEAGKAAWVAPRSLHDETVLPQPIGEIYNTITNGKNNMGAYGAMIKPHDRWCIVLYVKALQKARTGTPEDLPAGFREEGR